MTRREAREQAFVLLFEKSFNPQAEIGELIDLAKEFGMYEEDEYSNSVVHTACENMQAIDEQISNYARGWKINRIPKVSLALIRLAMTEILYLENVPSGVSINEAVELAKKYASPEDASFVNGILGTVARAQ
ncbi:MAG TPA: transcription antitermination factor NusB [Ruminococcaceae bacterium]|nr:transcription antitermination factor NusB [Oscillospiraceae bacterium]